MGRGEPGVKFSNWGYRCKAGSRHVGDISPRLGTGYVKSSSGGFCFIADTYPPGCVGLFLSLAYTDLESTGLLILQLGYACPCITNGEKTIFRSNYFKGRYIYRRATLYICILYWKPMVLNIFSSAAGDQAYWENSLLDNRAIAAVAQDHHGRAE